MSKLRELSVDEIEKEYSIEKANLGRLSRALNEQVVTLLDEEKIQLGFPIQARVKTLESINEKVGSGRFKPKTTILELQDLVGLRVVLLFKKDIERVSALIKANLTVVKQYNTSDKLKDDQFGYSSLHYVVQLPSEWDKVPTLKGLGNIQAEIQIRTLSQHTWAEASNVLQYKQESNVPKELVRSIGRVSALLETVDLEFDRLLLLRDEYQTTTLIEIGNKADILLNVDNLRILLDERLPAKNKIDWENYSTLLEYLLYDGITKVKQLETLIDNNLQPALEADRKTVNLLANPETRASAKADYNESRTIAGVFLSHVGLIKHMLHTYKHT